MILSTTAEPIGPGVCHNGYESCFYRTLQEGGWQEQEGKVYNADEVYGASK